MIQKFKIQTTKTARYFQIGELSSMTKNVWIVLHGYGMLPEYFIKKFECIGNKDQGPLEAAKISLKSINVKVGSGDNTIPLINLITNSQIIELEEILESFFEN